MLIEIKSANDIDKYINKKITFTPAIYKEFFHIEKKNIYKNYDFKFKYDVNDCNKMYVIITSNVASQSNFFDTKLGLNIELGVETEVDKNFYFEIYSVIQKAKYNEYIFDYIFDRIIQKYIGIIYKKEVIIERNIGNIYIEENNTNFGHIDIVWKGNISFPFKLDEQYFNENIESRFFHNKIGFKGSSNIFFDKQKEIESKFSTLKSDDKPYFKLFRYRYGHKRYKPNNLPGPTLSLSLFKPTVTVSLTQSFRLFKIDGEWFKKYVINQLRICIMFNYYFNNGNFRCYFDYYLFEEMRSIQNSDDFKISVLIKEFDYDDLEKNDETEKAKIFLSQFYDELKKKEDTLTFDNLLEKLLFVYDMASSSYFSGGKLVFGEKKGDFFVYKFDNPFIEDSLFIEEGTIDEQTGEQTGKQTFKTIENHITNGYIGQYVRYISARQRNYLYDGSIISSPKHIIWRDAHSNCIGYNDHLWIKELNTFALVGKTVYLLPNSLDYVRPWHGFVKCNINDQYYMRTAIGGDIQMINPEFNYDDLLYLQTIGLGFIIDDELKIPIKEYRSSFKPFLKKIMLDDNMGLITPTDYDYGIDEYILSSLFDNIKIKKFLILLNVSIVSHIFAHIRNPSLSYLNCSDSCNHDNYYTFIKLIFIIIFNFLYKHKLILSKKQSIREIIDKLESIRNNKNIIPEQFREIFGFLLSFIPTKYNLRAYKFIKSSDVTDMETDIYKTLLVLDMDSLTNSLFRSDGEETRKKYISKIVELSYENLNFFGINCRTNIVSMSSLEWCQAPYLKYSPNGYKKCYPTNFMSGYYADKPPSLDIGILRQPSDLKYSIEALEKNKLLLPLNRSDYKLATKSDNFKDVVSNITVNGELDEKIIKLILTSENIDDLTKIKTNLTPKLMQELLIWRSLNYIGYDVPPEWYQIDMETDNEAHEQLNELVKTISQDSEWLERFKAQINHSEYTSYKMATYKKYLKYKQKYINLKLSKK